MAKKKIEVYSTPTCPWCKKTKEFLKEHNVEFTDIDVTQDQEALNRMVEKSKQSGVPVIIIDGGEPIVGFDKERIAKEAGIA